MDSRAEIKVRSNNFWGESFRFFLFFETGCCGWGFFYLLLCFFLLFVNKRKDVSFQIRAVVKLVSIEISIK